jgi:hypothetical protein
VNREKLNVEYESPHQLNKLAECQVKAYTNWVAMVKDRPDFTAVVDEQISDELMLVVIMANGCEKQTLIEEEEELFKLIRHSWCKW